MPMPDLHLVQITSSLQPMHQCLTCNADAIKTVTRYTYTCNSTTNCCWQDIHACVITNTVLERLTCILLSEKYSR